MNKIIEYIIRAKDATASGIGSALSKLKNFAKTVGTNLQNIRAGFEMVKGAAEKFLAAMGKSFAFEKMTAQFKFLIGNMDEAREHMRMLQEMGDMPPFSLEEFAAASRSLMVLTEGALGFRKSLEMVGDAAAATGVDIKSMADYVGRAYAIIRDGQPITRATMTLRNMGAITPEVAAKLDAMQKAGKSNYEIWEELTRALGKFSGAMAETEKTGSGMVAAIGSLWDDTIRDFGGAVLDTTKDALGSLLEWMKSLREDGTIEVWAQKCGDAISSLVDGFKELQRVGETVLDAIWNKSGLSDVWHQIKGKLNGAGAMIGTLAGGGSFRDAAKDFAQANADESMKGYYTRKIVEKVSPLLGDDNPYKKALGAMQEEEAEGERRIEEARKRGVEKYAKSKSDAEAKAAQEAQKIRDDMAKKQREHDEAEEKKKAEYKKSLATDIANAELEVEAKRIDAEHDKNDESAKHRLEQAKKYLDALKKITDEDAKKKLDAENAVANKRIDNEKKVYEYKKQEAEKAFRKEKELADKNYRESLERQQTAETRLEKAQEKVKQAWGWYRDPESMQSVIDDYKEQKEAEKKWEKDFDKLKSKHRNWRDLEMGQLSAEEEATKQVALAKEEEKKAKEDLAKIAANTEHLKAIAAALDAKEGE